MKHIKRFNEGVADEYAKKRFNIENPDEDFEYNYQNYIAKIPPVEYVADDYNKEKLTAIYKNPKNLRNFEPNVRAIGTLGGDLYVAQRDSSFYHRSMGEQLKLVEDGEKIYDLNDKFVFCYRLRNKPAFAIGISTEYFNDDSEENVKITENILKNIKRKNPQFNFYNFTKSQIYELGNKALPVTLDITKYEPEQPKTPFSFGTYSQKQGMFTKFKNFIKK